MSIDKFINEISREAPKRFKDVVETKTRDNKDKWKNFAKEAQRRGKISKAQRYEIDKKADRGDFNQTYKEANPEVQKEMRKFVDTKMEKAQKEGRLNKPTDSEKERYDKLSNKWK